MKNKVTVAISIVIVAAVLVTLTFYVLGASFLGLPDYGIPAVALLIVAIAVLIVAMNYKNFRLGLPVKDERTKKIDAKACRYAFIATIWIALGTAMMEDYVTLPWRYNSYIIMLGSALVFLISYLILYYKGSA